jgi:hypothetical protein
MRRNAGDFKLFPRFMTYPFSSKSRAVRAGRPLLLYSFLLLAVAPQIEARVFYVSTSGVDGRTGTISDPWRTIGYATILLRTGDTLYVRGGVYHEVLNPTYSGAAGAPIVYSAYPGEYVLIDGPLDGKHEIVTQWLNYIIIQGFTFKDQDFLLAPGKEAYWVSLFGSNVIFRYNRLIADGNAYENYFTHNELSRGIVVGGTNVTVEHCFVRGLDFGIVIGGTSPRYVILRHDTVYATNASNIDVQATNGLSSAYHSTLIEHCVLDTSWTEDNIQFEHDYSNAQSTLYNRGTIVRNNRCGNAAENAIDLKGAEHIVIDNNLLYSSSGDDNGPFGGNDLTSGPGLTTKSPGVLVRKTLVRFNLIYDNLSGAVMTEGDVYYNNTFLNNRRTWKGPNQPDNVHFGVVAWSEPGADRLLVNNIIAGQPDRAVVRFTLDTISGKFFLNNNLYYDAANKAKFYHAMAGVYTLTEGIEAWKTVLSKYAGYAYIGGKEAMSIEADPQFDNSPLDPTGFNPSWSFSLRSTSPAVDAGRSVAFAQNSGSGSTTLVVDNAYCFCDGFGITDGDLIRIGRGKPVRIASIDYDTHTITLAEACSWINGMGVDVGAEGVAPDIGAREFPFVGTAPETPWLLTPANGTTGVSTEVALTWIASPDALSYEVHVASDSTFASGVFLNQSGITTTTKVLNGLGYDTQYFWRVNASNRAGASGFAGPWKFRTGIRVPNAPALVFPPNGAMNQETLGLILRWSRLADATQYRLQIGTDSTFASGLFKDDSTLTDTMRTLNGLRISTKYYWRVRGRNAGGPGDFSPTWSFKTVILLPSQVTLVSPAQQSTLSQDSARFVWNGTTPSSTQFWFEISLDSTFSMFSSIDSTVTDTSRIFKPLVNKVTYFWRVRGGNADGWGPFSERRRFLALITSAQRDQGIPAEYTLHQNYPNPFNPSTTIRYDLPRRSHVVLTIYSTLGQIVRELVNADVDAGYHSVNLDATGLSSGVYFYRMSAGDFVETKRLLLLQ